MAGFSRLDKLDKHSFWLKIAALFAKALCVIPIIDWVLHIYLTNEQRAAGVNTLSITFFFLICLPAMVWGFFLYYYDALFARKGQKTAVAKVLVSVLLYLLLSALNVFLLWIVCRNVVVMGAAFIGIFLFGYWGYAASVKSYSEVLSVKTMIVIACVYIFYLLFLAFMWISSSRTLVINSDPVVLGVVLFGMLAFIVLNQSSVDYEMQNRDAESADARRNIQKFNLRVSLVLVGALAVLYFTRHLISNFLGWILLQLRNIITWITNVLGGVGDINVDIEKEFSADQHITGDGSSSADSLITDPMLVFFVALVLLIVLIVVFRKQIVKAMRKAVKLLSKFFRIKTYTARGTSQYYRDLVEEIDEDEARRMFASDARQKRNRKALVREYDKLTDPTARVRRALFVLRHLFEPEIPGFRDGDTARQTTRQIDPASAPLESYAVSYENVRYNDAAATPSEGDAAATLVHGAYDQVKASKPAKA